jgi:hypothetical protein
MRLTACFLRGLASASTASAGKAKLLEGITGQHTTPATKHHQGLCAKLMLATKLLTAAATSAGYSSHRLWPPKLKPW